MTSSKRPSTSTVERPSRVINSVAPIRICDNGGWTDTWFAEHGKVFNIGVYPYVEVQIEVYPRDSREDRIILYAENYAERDAIYAGDFNALGAAMVENTEAQAALHPELVNADAVRVLEIARRHGAIGWKVNGAGGEGGSLTLLCPPLSHVKRAMVRAIKATNPLYQAISIYLSRQGLRIWEQPGDAVGRGPAWAKPPRGRRD